MRMLNLNVVIILYNLWAQSWEFGFWNDYKMVALIRTLTLLFVAVSSILAARWPPTSTVKDTTNITKVYLVSSCHLDLGFADSLVNIVNRYFDDFFPAAIKTARELKTESKERLVFTTHPYLVWLYTYCPIGSGLHCPDNASLESFKTAVRDGDIVWHAFPFNAQPEVYDMDMADFGFQLTNKLARDLNYSPLAMSQRDVPGLTRSLVPIMSQQMIQAVTVGVNAACMPPAVPTAFKWRDPTSGTSVIGMWHPHGYGGQHGVSLESSVIVNGLSSALAFAIRGDNSGPPSIVEILKNYLTLHILFHNAEIVASGYNEFVKELILHQDLLPEVTEEIGDNLDTWSGQ